MGRWWGCRCCHYPHVSNIDDSNYCSHGQIKSTRLFFGKNDHCKCLEIDYFIMDLARRRCDEVFVTHAEQLHGIPVYEYRESEDAIQLKLRNGLDEDEEYTIFTSYGQEASPVVLGSKHAFSFVDVVEKGWVRHGDSIRTTDQSGVVDCSDHSDSPVIVDTQTGDRHSSLVSFITRSGQLEWRGGLDNLRVKERYTWWQLEHLNRTFLVYNEKWLPLPYASRLASVLHDAADLFYWEEQENIDEIMECSTSDNPMMPFIQQHVAIVEIKPSSGFLWTRMSFYGHQLTVYQDMLNEAYRLRRIE